MIKRAQWLALLVALTMALGLLAACGGETATSTPVPTNTAVPVPTDTAAPPTNTVAPPTNTALPATDTAVPATDTAVPAAATDTAMPAMASTDTPAASGAMAATAMPGGMMAGTATVTSAMPGGMMGGTATVTSGMTGGMMAGTATMTSGMTGGMVATSADDLLITQAYTATKDVKSYHFTMDASGFVVTGTESVNVEGDYVAPDKIYAKGTLNGATEEQLTIGGKTYRKDAGGKWVIDTTTAATTGMANPADITRQGNVLDSLGSLLTAGGNYRDTGSDETIDGVTTKHFSGQILATKMEGASALGALASVPSLGKIDLWIDPSTKYIHKMSMDLDMGPFMKAMQDLMEAMQGTPTPGGPPPTPMPSMKFTINLNISRHNDPSITVPTP